jgi:hypothetical protein
LLKSLGRAIPGCGMAMPTANKGIDRVKRAVIFNFMFDFVLEVLCAVIGKIGKYSINSRVMKRCLENEGSE